jgi:hypothetical protein
LSACLPSFTLHRGARTQRRPFGLESGDQRHVDAHALRPATTNLHRDLI